jgi:Flp pilus assembly pilin Flp
MLNVFAAYVPSRLALTARDESGQGLIEYSLILFLIVILAFGALTLIGTNVTSILSSVANGL